MKRMASRKELEHSISPVPYLVTLAAESDFESHEVRQGLGELDSDPSKAESVEGAQLPSPETHAPSANGRRHGGHGRG